MERADIVAYVKRLAAEFPRSIVDVPMSNIETMSTSSLVELSDELEDMLLHREAAA